MVWYPEMPKLVHPENFDLPTEWNSNGCFETMRVYRGRMFRFDAHLDRLYASAKSLGTITPSRKNVRREVLSLLEKSQMKEAVVRIAFYPQSGQVAQLVTKVLPVPKISPDAYRKGIEVAIVPGQSFQVSAIDAKAKYSARLGSKLAIMDAQVRGVDEAVFMGPHGYVTENTASNIGLVKNGQIKTPPCSLGLLWGITRDVLFQIGEEIQMPVQEMPLTRHDFYNADEVFMTSSIKEVMPVTRMDGRLIAQGKPGPVTQKLRERFHACMLREIERESASED